MKQGTPIGLMDMPIAGHAKSEDLILATNNTREFERVKRLKDALDPGTEPGLFIYQLFRVNAIQEGRWETPSQRESQAMPISSMARM